MARAKGGQGWPKVAHVRVAPPRPGPVLRAVAVCAEAHETGTHKALGRARLVRSAA